VCVRESNGCLYLDLTWRILQWWLWLWRAA